MQRGYLFFNHILKCSHHKPAFCVTIFMHGTMRYRSISSCTPTRLKLIVASATTWINTVSTVRRYLYIGSLSNKSSHSFVLLWLVPRCGSIYRCDRGKTSGPEVNKCSLLADCIIQACTKTQPYEAHTLARTSHTSSIALSGHVTCCESWFSCTTHRLYFAKLR